MTEYSSEIRAVLFDADGVVQCAVPGWLEKLKKLGHGQNNNEQILTEIFEAEKPSLTGHVAFEVPLESILLRWGSSVSVSDALLLWNMIEPDESVLAVISALRKHVTIGLATNQQRHRAKFMLNDLGYAKLFDHIFLSSDIGYVKPDIEFFNRVLGGMELQGQNVLFIDYKLDNVESAKKAGMHAQHYCASSGVSVLTGILRRYGISID
jgi:putative hydrolase of the HAD superfamily